MLDITYLYHLPTADIPVTGFIAYLLQLGDAWDIRCLEADMYDYHAQQYARMNPTIALQQELQWWCDFVEDDFLCECPLYDDLADAGLCYLQWRVKEQIAPLSDSDKLTTDMEIHMDEHRYFYKINEALGLLDPANAEPEVLLFGFPAQLLTYAACTTMDSYIRQDTITNPMAWVDSMIGWLQSHRLSCSSMCRWTFPMYIPSMPLLSQTRKQNGMRITEGSINPTNRKSGIS